MGQIKFSNGVTMSFEGNPTSADIDEMAQVAAKQTKESIPQMIGRNASNAWKESGGAILSSINDLTANNIKPNVARVFGEDKASAIFPEQKTLEGKVLRFASGFAVPAAKVVQGLGILKGGVAVGAAYGAGQDILNPDTSLQERGTNAIVGGGLGLATAGAVKAAPSILKKTLDLVPRPIQDKIFNLYNESIGTKIKNPIEAKTIRASKVNVVKTISDNLPDVKLLNPDTGGMESRIPQTREENLQAFQQVKELIWKNNVTKLSQGATDKGAKIDLSSLVDTSLTEAKKNIGMVALKANPQLSKALDKTSQDIKKVGEIDPTQAQDYLKYLNDQIQTLRKSGQAVDFSKKDLLNSLRYKLAEETDNVIEKTLGQSGYGEARKQYSDLRGAQKEILAAANKYYRQNAGGGFIHPIIDLWSLEEVLQSAGHAIAGNPLGATLNLGRAVTIKGASKIVDFMRSPDRKIRQMYELAAKYSKPVSVIPQKYKSIKRSTP